jgi:hypothetical protein
MVKMYLQFVPDVGFALALGAIIGFVCRGRIGLQLVLSLVLSASSLVIGSLLAGDVIRPDIAG